jgi:hypothetical protein
VLNTGRVCRGLFDDSLGVQAPAILVQNRLNQRRISKGWSQGTFPGCVYHGLIDDSLGSCSSPPSFNDELKVGKTDKKASGTLPQATANRGL